MARNNVREINDNNFENEVLHSSLPVMVHFSATWCGPCKALSPTVERIADEYEGKIKVCKLDIDDSPAVSRNYGVRSVPTVIVYRNGEKKAEQKGLTNYETLIKLI